MSQKEYPLLVLLFSGKRKSGKDYTVEVLKQKLNPNFFEVIRISEPIKSHWAKMFNLDLNELLSENQYKEKYRLDMIKWSEDIRNKDYGFFCQLACNNAIKKPLWIVSDIRRKTDIKWFSENYKKIKTVRIVSSDLIRIKRGWEFQKGIDDAESECNLDDVTNWDIILTNDDNIDDFLKSIDNLLDIIKENIPLGILK